MSPSSHRRRWTPLPCWPGSPCTPTACTRKWRPWPRGSRTSRAGTTTWGAWTSSSATSSTSCCAPTPFMPVSRSPSFRSRSSTSTTPRSCLSRPGLPGTACTRPCSATTTTRPPRRRVGSRRALRALFASTSPASRRSWTSWLATTTTRFFSLARRRTISTRPAGFSTRTT